MNDGFKYNWPIIGHDNIKKFLQTSIVNNSLAHAYLFHGPERVGKTLTAKIFAKSVLCGNYKRYVERSGELTQTRSDVELPCGVCEQCVQFDKGVYADMYWVEREVDEKSDKKKSNITVAQIRELLEKISKRAFLNFYKIIIIPEAHCLSREAGNCLLKTLEEPAAKTILILISSNKELLLPTILSRCQIFKFLPITKRAIYDYLVEKGANRSMANELSSLAQGRPTVAMQFFDSSEKRQAFQQGLAELLSIFKQSPVERFKFVESFVKKHPAGDDLIEKLNDLSGLTRDILLLQNYNQEQVANLLLEKELGELAEKYSAEKLRKLVAEIEQTKVYLKQNINPRLALENLLLDL